MTSFDDDDETLERELFARRAETLPSPVLNLADVFARAKRGQALPSGERTRIAQARLARGVAWVGALTCAAASWLVAIGTHEPSFADGAQSMSANEPRQRPPEGEEGEGLACSMQLASRRTAEAVESLDDRPLACGRDVTFSVGRP